MPRGHARRVARRPGACVPAPASWLGGKEAAHGGTPHPGADDFPQPSCNMVSIFRRNSRSGIDPVKDSLMRPSRSMKTSVGNPEIP